MCPLVIASVNLRILLSCVVTCMLIMLPVFFVSASPAIVAAYLSLSVVAVPAVHDSSDCVNSFAFVGRDPGQQGAEESEYGRSKAEEQLQPQTDARRLAARCAAAMLALRPLDADAERGAWPAKQSIMNRDQMAMSVCGVRGKAEERLAPRIDARLPCRCHAAAMQVPCSCHAAAMQLPCSCHAGAVQVPCSWMRGGSPRGTRRLCSCCSRPAW